MGNDGFSWWVGQVEGTARDEANNKGGYRFKVRIVGDHPGSKEILDTPDLPWANVMMPVNVPFMPGNGGGASVALEKGCWVVGFYLDNDKQKPLIMGSLGMTPGATRTVIDERPDLAPFTTYIRGDVIPEVDGTPTKDSGDGGEPTNTATGGLTDGTNDATGKPRVAIPTRKTAKLKKGNPSSREWCQEQAEKCDDPDMSTKMNSILGGFLENVQASNGNIGTYYVNQATGKLNEAVGTARRYVNKAMRVVNEFIAGVKGYILQKISNGVKDLIHAVLQPSEEGNALTPVTEFFNNLLKDLGCQMADLGTRLEEWLTNLLMSYINQIYRSVICQVDELVNGIMSKINELMNEILGSVLGPLQDILGAIAAPLNILGGAINFVLNLLGITCSGPDRSCAKYKKVCTDGEEQEGEDDKDFLDNLLGDIDNLFGDTPSDYTQYVCAEAFTGKPLTLTTVGFTGGVPLPGGDQTSGGPGGNTKKKPKIVYSISDIEVTEGEDAVFTVSRYGSTEFSSSVKFRTLKDVGTATPGEDFLETKDIVGFAPGETQKTISVKTFYSEVPESVETFFVQIKKNTPGLGSKISSNFEKQVAQCSIIQYNKQDPSTPYPLKPTNPIPGIEESFPPADTDIPSDPDTGVDFEDVVTPSYSVIANRETCPEGEFIVYSISTQNVENGSLEYYTLLGEGITSDDIVGGGLSGSFVVNNNSAKVTIGIEDDDVVEDSEILTFFINGTGASVDVTIVDKEEKGLEDFEDEVDNPEDLPFEGFIPPTVDPGKIITDPGGGIIEIPISNPGDPWAEPPYVFIGGEGIGASATALLDDKGFLTEIRIKTSGYGYKKNLADDNNVRCIIDDFTLIRPGSGYLEIPDIYVNDELGIAEAVINEDGFVIGARILDRTRTFDRFPKVTVVGGGGYGAKLLPSLVCLDTQELSTRGATKIGTGKYIDCP